MRFSFKKLSLGMVLPALLAVPIATAALADDGISTLSATDRFPGLSLFDSMTESFRPETQNQVRIEERVIVRIAPIRPAARQALQDRSNNENAPPFQERPLGDCVGAGDIAGVSLGSQNRLVFLMRDRKLVSVHLDRSCPAREFYSGFYVERSDDGLLCVKRDRIHARSGANCEVDSFHAVVVKRN